MISTRHGAPIGSSVVVFMDGVTSGAPKRPVQHLRLQLSVLVKGDCAEALGRDLVTRGGMREVKSPCRSVAELFT